MLDLCEVYGVTLSVMEQESTETIQYMLAREAGKAERERRNTLRNQNEQ